MKIYIGWVMFNIFPLDISKAMLSGENYYKNRQVSICCHRQDCYFWSSHELNIKIIYKVKTCFLDIHTLRATFLFRHLNDGYLIIVNKSSLKPVGWFVGLHQSSVATCCSIQTAKYNSTLLENTFVLQPGNEPFMTNLVRRGWRQVFPLEP